MQGLGGFHLLYGGTGLHTRTLNPKGRVQGFEGVGRLEVQP